MKTKLLNILKITFAVSLFMSLLFSLDFFASWQAKLTDKLFAIGEPSSNIVIVKIDNYSLQQVGRWPWERSVHADLIRKIASSAPAVIGYDVNFPEDYIEEQDNELAQVIQEAGNIILPIEARITIGEKVIADELLMSIEKLSNSASDLGLVNTLADKDGIYRKVPLYIYTQTGKKYYHIDQRVAELYLSERGYALPEVKTDKQGRMRINYVGEPGSFNSVSAVEVINGNVKPEVFRNKIVLVGATAPDLHDEQLTPVTVGLPMSGVEIIANGIDTIINGRFIMPVSKWYQVLILILLAFTVSSLMTFFRVSRSSFMVLGVFGLYIIVSILAFDQGLLLDLYYPILTILFAYIASVVWRYINEANEKRHIKKAFSRYVSPDVINDLLANPSKLKLGGENRELSIMFSDIRGFTSISEKLTPEQLVSLLNKYLSSMTDIILSSRGVVDKYIGDAIMAFWGAPLEQPRHADRACEVALDMMKTLKVNRLMWEQEYGVELNIGIGINSGNVIIGNMGSDQRFDYTVMGDCVNLASRLEGITKQYGVPIVVSESTRNKAKDKFIFRFLDKVAVKGKKEGVKIFELVSKKEDFLEEDLKRIRAFEKGMRYYCSQEWEAAEEYYRKLLEEYPEDAPTRIYLERIKELKIDPPGEAWDRIYVMKTK